MGPWSIFAVVAAFSLAPPSISGLPLPGQFRRDAALLHGTVDANDLGQLEAFMARYSLTPSEQADVERWISQLGAASFPVRDRAQRNLLQAGPGVGMLLKRSLNDPDLERRRRVEACWRHHAPPIAKIEAVRRCLGDLADLESDVRIARSFLNGLQECRSDRLRSLVGTPFLLGGVAVYSNAVELERFFRDAADGKPETREYVIDSVMAGEAFLSLASEVDRAFLHGMAADSWRVVLVRVQDSWGAVLFRDRLVIGLVRFAETR